MLGIDMAKVQYKSIKVKSQRNLKEDLVDEWSFSFDLKASALQNFDPLPILVHILMECPSLRPHRSHVFRGLPD